MKGERLRQLMGAQEEGSERRRAVRWPSQMQLELSWPAGRLPVSVADFNAQGIRFEARGGLPAGLQAGLDIELVRENAEASPARLVWIRARGTERWSGAALFGKAEGGWVQRLLAEQAVRPNHRSAIRVSTDQRVTANVSGRELALRMLDLSVQGARLEGETPLSVGQALHLQMFGSGVAAEIRRVVHLRDCYQFGVRFAPGTEQAEQLRAWVDRLRGA